MSWGKLHTSMFTGSMVGAGPTVFAVWAFVVAHVRHSDNSVELNSRILAATLGTTVDDIDKAIDYLCSPDPQSRSDAHEGRRLLKEGAFLYHVVNAEKYQMFRDDDARREYQRDLMREKRKADPTYGQKKVSTQLAPVSKLAAVSHGAPQLAQEEVEVEEEENNICSTVVERVSVREESNDTALSSCTSSAKNSKVTDADIMPIYWAYPRHKSPHDAAKAITKALKDTPYDELMAKTKLFAGSPAGQAGQYVPYPASWFNAGGYKEDPAEWHKTPGQATSPPPVTRSSSIAAIGTKAVDAVFTDPIDILRLSRTAVVSYARGVMKSAEYHALGSDEAVIAAMKERFTNHPAVIKLLAAERSATPTF